MQSWGAGCKAIACQLSGKVRIKELHTLRGSASTSNYRLAVPNTCASASQLAAISTASQRQFAARLLLPKMIEASTSQHLLWQVQTAVKQQCQRQTTLHTGSQLTHQLQHTAPFRSVAHSMMQATHAAAIASLGPNTACRVLPSQWAPADGLSRLLSRGEHSSAAALLPTATNC